MRQPRWTGWFLMAAVLLPLRAQPLRVLRPLDLEGTSWLSADSRGCMMTSPVVASCVAAFGERYAREAEGTWEPGISWPDPAELLSGVAAAVDPGCELRRAVGSSLIWLYGTPTAQEVVSRALAALRRFRMRGAEVLVAELPPAAWASVTSPVLGPDAVDALLKAHPSAARYRSRVRMGARARIVSAHRRTCLPELDVAASQTIWPEIDPHPFLGGLEIGVRVDEVADGRLLLIVQGRRGEEDAPRRVVQIPRLGALEFLHAAIALGASTAIVPDGGGLVLGGHGPEGFLWLVRVGRTGVSGAAALAPDVELVPAAVLAVPPQGQAPPWLGPPGGSGFRDSASDVGGPVTRGAALLTADEVGDAFSDLLPPGGGADVALWDTTLRVRGPAAVRTAVHERLRTRVGEARTVAIEVRWGLVALADRVGTGDTALVERLDHRGLVAARAGDDCLFGHGTQESFLRDFDIEISPAVIGLDPVTEALFSGVTFFGRPTLAADGRIRLLMELLWQEPHGPMTTYQPTPSSWPLDLPNTSFSDVRATLRLRPGVWTLAHEASLADGRVLMVYVRVRM